MAVPEPMILPAIRFSTANPGIRVNTGAAQTLTLAVSVGANYFFSGDGGADDLCAILQTALNTNSNGVTFTVTISARNFITITASASSSILWADALTTVDETLFGFPANVGPGTSFTAPDQTKGVWIPSTSDAVTAVRGFLTDSKVEPVTVGHLAEAIDGSCRGYDLSSSRGERSVSFHLIERAKILTALAASDEPYGALEYSWTQYMARGREVRVYDDRTSRTANSYRRCRMKNRGRPWREMDVSRLKRYEVAFSMREVT